MSSDASTLLKDDHRTFQKVFSKGRGFDFISGKPKRARNEAPEPTPDNHHKRDA